MILKWNRWSLSPFTTLVLGTQISVYKILFSVATKVPYIDIRSFTPVISFSMRSIYLALFWKSIFCISFSNCIFFPGQSNTPLSLPLSLPLHLQGYAHVCFFISCPYIQQIMSWKADTSCCYLVIFHPSWEFSSA